MIILISSGINNSKHILDTDALCTREHIDLLYISIYRKAFVKAPSKNKQKKHINTQIESLRKGDQILDMT